MNKFNIGDLVYNEYYNNIVSVITNVYCNSYGYTYKLDNDISRYHESYLKPLEGKPINFLTIADNTPVYNPTFGEGKIISKFGRVLKILFNNKLKDYDALGRVYDSKGEPSLYPNKELYQKYPLDFNKAWREYFDSVKPKHNITIKVFSGVDGTVSKCILNKKLVLKENPTHIINQLEKYLSKYDE